MFRKIVGFFFWAIPWIGLAFLAGWLTHSREWPELKRYAL